MRRKPYADCSVRLPNLLAISKSRHTHTRTHTVINYGLHLSCTIRKHKSRSLYRYRYRLLYPTINWPISSRKTKQKKENKTKWRMIRQFAKKKRHRRCNILLLLLLLLLSRLTCMCMCVLVGLSQCLAWQCGTCGTNNGRRLFESPVARSALAKPPRRSLERGFDFGFGFDFEER